MKKLTLLVVLLVAVGMVGFALEVKPTFALTGSATLTWGVALGTTATTGFTNATASSLTVSLLAADGTDTHAGKGAIRGSITISNVEMFFTENAEVDGAKGVSAVLFVDPLEIGIAGAPAMNADKAGVLEDTAAFDSYPNVDALMNTETTLSYAGYAGKGTYVKYAGETFWVKADIVSKDTHTANTNNLYAAGLEASATLGPVTAGLGAFMGLGDWTPTVTTDASPISGYVSASSTIPGFGPVSVGFDWESAATFLFDVGGSVQFNINKDATQYVKLSAFMSSVAAEGTDLKIAVAFPVDALSLTASAWINDLGVANSMDIAALVSGSYKVALTAPMSATPGVAVAFGQNGATSTSSLYITPSVVLALAEAPAVSLTTKWTSGDLLATTPGMGAITSALTVTY